MPTNTRAIIGTTQIFENNNPCNRKEQDKEEKLEGETETGVTPEEYLQDQITLLTDVIPSPLVLSEKDQSKLSEKSEKELKDLEKQFNELKTKQESELNNLKEKLSKTKEKCDKGMSDSAML